MACPMPKALAEALGKAWTLSTEQGRLPFNHPSDGKTFRPSAESGEGLLTYLTYLVSQGEKVTEGISLLIIKESR